MGVRLCSDESLGGGALEVYARRGEVAEEQAVPDLYSIVTIRCSDSRDRWAVWFQRVDPATIRAFFSHFRICN
jgi:hypothetical protein